MPQGEPVSKPETFRQIILSLVCESDIKEAYCILSNQLLKKNVHGQKHLREVDEWRCLFCIITRLINWQCGRMLHIRILGNCDWSCMRTKGAVQECTRLVRCVIHCIGTQLGVHVVPGALALHCVRIAGSASCGARLTDYLRWFHVTMHYLCHISRRIIGHHPMISFCHWNSIIILLVYALCSGWSSFVCVTNTFDWMGSFFSHCSQFRDSSGCRASWQSIQKSRTPCTYYGSQCYINYSRWTIMFHCCFQGEDLGCS